MDGVIADFFGAMAKREKVKHWKSIKDKEVAFQKIMHSNFFYEIPRFEDYYENISDKIVMLIKDYSYIKNIEWGICSSPMRGDEYNSAYWKRLWLENYGYMPSVENCIFTHEKEKYAFSKVDGKPNILIDDKPENIFKFRKAGGIGIRFQTNEDDIEYLCDEMENALKLRNAV